MHFHAHVQLMTVNGQLPQTFFYKEKKKKLEIKCKHVGLEETGKVSKEGGGSSRGSCGAVKTKLNQTLQSEQEGSRSVHTPQ